MEYKEPEDKTVIDRKLKRYAELKSIVKGMEAEIKELEEEVAKEVATEYDGRLELPIGTFSIQMRKKWQFSEKIMEMEIKLKKAKKYEQMERVATVIDENPILVFKGV
jgi:hypothetical protein